MIASKIRPIYHELPYLKVIEFANAKLGSYQNVVYLHSAKISSDLARYSYIGFDPYELYVSTGSGVDDSSEILDAVDHALRSFHLESIPELPPFQGGILGYLSYDLIRTFEKIPNYAKSDVPTPRISACAYDLVVSIDHISRRAWLISSGFPEVEENSRTTRAEKRLAWGLAQFEESVIPMDLGVSNLKISDVVSNFTRDAYIKAIQQTIEFIRNGDIFQANISQRFLAKLEKTCTPYQLFLRLQRHNPAPFSAYINIGGIVIASSSPERFLKIHDGLAETRPIKGTRRRSLVPEQDQALATNLLNSEKDKAENAMIVDLMRNDLSKICEPGTIHVEKLCGLESFEYVHHLVSVITGKVNADLNFKELVQAVIPGGSITGAPKIRAMEIIDLLESTRRGPYCGNAFYYGFNGVFDSSILIRTYVIYNNEVRFNAGGAVVLDSDPEQEYDETLVKAAPLLQALTDPALSNVKEELV